MAKRRKYNVRKNKYSVNERRAYWIGVGASACNHGDLDKILGTKDIKLRNSLANGYSDDNHLAVSDKLFKV